MKKKVKVRTTRGGHVDGEDWTENLEDVFQAAAKGNVQSLRSHLSRGVSPAVKEQELFGYNLLHLAVLSGNRAAVQLILQYKPAINATANDGTTTALLLACSDSSSGDGPNPDIIRLLLNAGAHVSTLSSPGTYPLLAAAASSTTDAPIRLLLAAGASIAALDADERQTALHKAAYGRSPAVLAALLAAPGAARLLNAPDAEGLRPLHLAVDVPDDYDGDAAYAARRAEFARLLLAAGADANVLAADGTAPIHLAVVSRLAAAVGYLLEAGADVNLRDGDGWTPLMGAEYVKDRGIVALLERYGGVRASGGGGGGGVSRGGGSGGGGGGGRSGGGGGGGRRRDEEEEEEEEEAEFSGGEGGGGWTGEVRCGDCGKKFQADNALLQHQRATGHGDAEDDDSEDDDDEEDSDDDDEDDTTCLKCGRDFDSRNDLFRHLQKYPRHRA